jgi:hypothetical protein
MSSKKYLTNMMHDFTKLQASLLNWIKHHQTRSINQINSACVALMNGVGLDSQNALFKIFIPLVRMGFVEFLKGGAYCASMSVVLYYPKSNTAVAVNLSDKQKELFNQGFKDVSEDCFGTLRITTHRANITKFCKEAECPFSQPEISNLLSQFPTISQTVLNFERATVVSAPVEYYDVVSRRWTDAVNDPCICRISSDAQKTFLSIDGLLRLIPDRNTNPEGRLLAECYLGIRKFSNSLSYNKDTYKLQISKITIPILIERLLRLASLDVPGSVIQSSTSTVYPSITNQTTKEIYRIFEYNSYEQSN